MRTLESYEHLFTNNNQKEIIEHYGIRKQAKHFMSECTELFEAILEHDLYTDYMGSGTDTEHDKKDHVEEEIADVLNFIEQFIVHFELDTERIKDIQVKKQERTIYEFKNNIRKEDRV